MGVRFHSVCLHTPQAGLTQIFIYLYISLPWLSVFLFFSFSFFFFLLLSLLQHQIKNTRGDGFQPSRTSKTVISVCCFFLTLGNVSGLTIAIHMAFLQRFSFFLPLAGWKLLNAERAVSTQKKKTKKNSLSIQAPRPSKKYIPVFFTVSYRVSISRGTLSGRNNVIMINKESFV